MTDAFQDSRARLEGLLKRVMTEKDPAKYDDLSAEIWKVLDDLEALRKRQDTQKEGPD